MKTLEGPLNSVQGSLALDGKAAFRNRCVSGLGVGGPFVATVLGIVLLCLGVIKITWADVAIFMTMYTITGLGVTVGLHRLFAHRSFEATRFTQGVLAVLGIMAIQGNVTGWVATHRRHHRFSDQHGDPHSPKERRSGFIGTIQALFYVHFGRLFLAEDTSIAIYAADLAANPMIQKIDRLALLWVFITLALPAAAGYWFVGGMAGAFSGFLWGGLVRIFIGQNVGSCVNSVCHMFGQTLFKTADLSKNNVWIGVAAFGEGWHNNHHAFPASAKQGLLWWQLDMSYWLISTLKFLGLAWSVKVPHPELIERKKITATA